MPLAVASKAILAPPHKLGGKIEAPGSRGVEQTQGRKNEESVEQGGSCRSNVDVDT